MKIYLSGPDNNVPAFNRDAKALRDAGHDVVSPAEIFVDGDVSEPDFYNRCLRADLKAMMDCDAIALMDGWENSRGAHLELSVAHRVGMSVHFVSSLLAEREVTA